MGLGSMMMIKLWNILYKQRKKKCRFFILTVIKLELKWFQCYLTAMD